MIPQTRTDLFLAKITGEDVELPVPQTRFELYLANIAGESYELPAPNSRATLYLAKILGQDVALPVPQTRSELYLASIAGMSVQLPEAPTTREEWYLARWAEDAGYVVITGNPVSFQAVAAKLRQLKIAFSPVQEGSGDPSPENERPIHGWTGVNVWQRGQNLCDWDSLVDLNGYAFRGITFSYSDGVLTYGTEAVKEGAINIFRRSNSGNYYTSIVLTDDLWLPAGEYVCTETCIYGTAVGSTTSAAENSRAWAGSKFSLPNGGYITPYASWNGAGAVSATRQLSVTRWADEDEPYVPYNGQLIPVVFPDGETYYRGWVDPTTGDGISDMAYWKYAGDTPISSSTGSLGMGKWYTLPVAAKAAANSGVNIDALESMGFVQHGYYYGNAARIESTPARGQYGDFVFGDNSHRNRVLVYIVGATAETYDSLIAGFELCYEIAPIPFHVDPQQINSLAGANTMWTDADTLTVEYRKDGNVSDAEALSMLLGGRYTPATGPEDVSDSEALSIITGR